jgi:hypothetical protein
MLSNKLERFIAQGRKLNWSSQPFAGTIRRMIGTGLRKWGFVIYRCVYDDDEAWQRYMKYFEANALHGLDRHGGDVVVSHSVAYRLLEPVLRACAKLPQYARWTVREDRKALNGATIDAVRKMLVEWRNEHSVEREVHWTEKLMPMLKDPPNRLPGFTYCLYVDQKCLNTVNAFAEWFPRPSRFAPRLPPLVAVLIDGEFDESQYVQGGLRAAPDEPGQFPAVDGRTCGYVGWEYVDTHGLGSRYEQLHSLRLDDTMDYMRPPKISPTGSRVLKDDGVQRI